MNADTQNRALLVLDSGLTPRELVSIGRIISQWGSLENEIFLQTLATFGELGQESLPKEITKNTNFKDGVLKLWKERVVDTSETNKKLVLQKEYESILELLDYRHALVHSMWEWDERMPDSITTIRVRDKKIISITFDAQTLEDFANKVGRVHFNIRYPSGTKELAEELAEKGFYMSRHYAAQVSGSQIVKDFEFLKN